MPLVLKPWIREVVISDEMLNSLPDNVRQHLLKDGEQQEKLKALLHYYYEVFQSHSKVAALLNVPKITVYELLLRVGVPVRERAWAKKRRLAKARPVNVEDRAILWILAHSDAGITKIGRRLHVHTSTPDPWLISLYFKHFAPYADVKLRPEAQAKWYFDATLPIEGFEWLSEDARAVLRNNVPIWTILPPLIDTEGSIREKV